MTIPIGFGQVTHLFTGLNVPTGAACTYGFINTGPLTAIARAELAHDAWGDTILTSQSDDIILTSTIVKLGPDATGTAAEWNDPRAGSIVATPAPPNVTFLVRKVTQLGGREGRGRMYIPGIDEVEVDPGGAISSTRRNGMQTQADALMTRLAANNMEMYLLHNSATPPTAIDELQVAGRVATQRRRLRR